MTGHDIKPGLLRMDETTRPFAQRRSVVPPFLRNPLTAGRDALDRDGVRKLFPSLGSMDHERVLQLRPYLTDTPQKWFDSSAFNVMYDWLRYRDATDRDALRSYFHQGLPDLDRAFLFLREINAASWHGRIDGGEDAFELLRVIDRAFHSAYLRLVEGVLVPLVRVVAHFSRLDRGVGTEGLEVWPVVEELRRGAQRTLVSPYEHLVRNAIAHGGIIYREREIQYHNRQGEEKVLSKRAIIRMTDDLVDVSNGIAAAMKVFLSLSGDYEYPLPRELLVEELKEETKVPWWSVEGCLESQTGKGSQLVIYSRTDPGSCDRGRGARPGGWP